MSQGAKALRSSALTRWLFLPVLILFGTSVQVTDSFSIYLSPLIVPTAVFICLRFGHSGLFVVMVSAIFLVPSFRTDTWELGRHFDIWLMALVAGSLAVGQRPLIEIVPKSPWSLRRLFMFLLLPLGIGFWGAELDVDILDLDEVRVSLEIGLTVVAFAFLLLAGMARVDVVRVLLILLCTMCLSQFLFSAGWNIEADEILDARRAQLPVLGYMDLTELWVRYGFRNLTTILQGAAYYAAGRVLAEVISDRELPNQLVRVVFVAVLAILAIGVVPFNYWSFFIGLGFDNLTAWISDLDGYSASCRGEITLSSRHRPRTFVYPLTPVFPIVGFFSGMFWAGRGYLAAFLATTVMLALGAIVRSDITRFEIPFSEIFVMAGFAAAGIIARNHLLSRDDIWWSASWAVYMALVAWCSIAVGIAPHSVSFALVVVLAAIAGLGAQWLRRWLHGHRVQPNPGWVALATLVALVTSVSSHIAPMWDAVQKLVAASTFGPMLDDIEEEWWVMALFAIFLFWIFVAALRVLVASAGRCWADIKKCILVLRALIKKQPMPAPSSAAAAEDETAAWWHPDRILRLLMIGTAWVGCLLAVAVLFRPTMSEIMREMERAREREAEIREEARSRVGQTQRVSDSQVAPLRLEALTNVLSSWVGNETSVRRGSGKITTGWHSAAGETDKRERAIIYLGRYNDPQYLRVSVDIQRRRYGIWVDPNCVNEDERAASLQLEARILEQIGE
jgi:hypothetical protein